MSDPKAARDVGVELDARPADLVVGDPLLLSTLQTLRKRGQPYALLEPTTDSLMRGRLQRLGKILWLRGLPVRRLLGGAEAIVAASAPELEEQVSRDVSHTGTDGAGRGSSPADTRHTHEPEHVSVSASRADVAATSRRRRRPSCSSNRNDGPRPRLGNATGPAARQALGVVRSCRTDAGCLRRCYPRRSRNNTRCARAWSPRACRTARSELGPAWNRPRR